MVSDCAETARAEGHKRAIDYTQFTLDGLRKGGMKVGPASDQLVGELKAIGETMTKEWFDSAGETGRKIVDAYKAM